VCPALTEKAAYIAALLLYRERRRRLGDPTLINGKLWVDDLKP
jgi:hypothetical protein